MTDKIEIEILKIVANHDEGRGWHGIATGLSKVELDHRPDMMSVLNKLTDEGLLSFDAEKKGWKITDAGRSKISKLEE